MALELNDDHETLEAALALIDEWELEVDGHDALPAPDVSRSPSTTADDDSDATRDSQASVPSPPPVRATRRRKLSSTDEQGQEAAAKQQLSRREELVFLRRRVRALEAELVALRDATVKEEKDSASGTTGLDATWVWQQIATRQREYRRTSELENLQLRLRVQEQLQVAKDLMRVLLRAYRHTDQPGQVEEPAVKRLKLPRHAQCEMTEEAQLRLIDELYGERDAIFAAAPFTGGPPATRTTRMEEHANGEATINVDSSWALPFSVDHITSAFWMYLVRKHEPTKWQFEPADHADDDRDILSAKFETTTTSNGQVCTLLGQFVARCLRSSDGQEPAYIAWHLNSHPVHSAPLSMDGVVVQNQSIVRVIWADQATGSDCAKPPCDTGRISLVQMSQRIHVAFAAAETPARRRRVGALTEFMLTTVPAELKWKQQVLENLLLRSTMPSMPPNAPKHSYTSLSLRSHADKAS